MYEFYEGIYAFEKQLDEVIAKSKQIAIQTMKTQTKTGYVDAQPTEAVLKAHFDY